MPSSVNNKIFPCTCIDLSTPKSEEALEEEEALITTLKWGKLCFDVILDREIFTYLKHKKYLNQYSTAGRSSTSLFFNWNNTPYYS